MNATSGETVNPLFEIILWTIERLKELNAEKITDYVLNAPQYYKIWWTGLYDDAPLHILVETGMLVFILWLMFIRKTVDPTQTNKNANLSKAETEWLLKSWVPEPLAPVLSETSKFIVENTPVVMSYKGDTMIIEGQTAPILNVGSFDFLGLSRDPDVKTATIEALDYYGCGSCGPRGFYGTIDKHLIFEEEMAKFFGTEEAISYSDSASCVTSVIPSFSKKGDLILVDECAGEPIISGTFLARSTVQRFKHNDMEDLRTILESIAADDKRLRRDPTQQRRFIIVEGLYRNVGDLCPLPEIVALKNQFCYRLMLDESTSFGAVGATGRGVTEHFNVPLKEVEIIMCAMDTSLASVGGVCCGDKEITDHQRLAGAGYCFSASAPPFLSAAAVVSLARMEREPKLLAQLHQNTAKLYDGFNKSAKLLQIKSDTPTAVMHLELVDPLSDLDKEHLFFLKVAKECQVAGVGVTASKCQYSAANRPSLMVCASATLTKAQLEKIVKTVAKVSEAVFKADFKR